MAKKYIDQNAFLYIWQKISNIFVKKESGKGLSTNDYTTEDKNKLAQLENYSLPTASTTVKGGIKVGTGLTMEGEVLSVTGGGTADSVDWSNITNKPETFAPSNHTHTASEVTGLAKADIGLGNVDNTSDADKPISTDTQAALDNKVNTSVLGQAGGVATLDGTGKVPSTQLPSYVDDVIEGYFYDNKFYSDKAHTSEITGEVSKIYIDVDSNLSYRYGGTTYTVITSSDMVAISNTEIDEIMAL